jgi:hypothetical protein
MDDLRGIVADECNAAIRLYVLALLNQCMIYEML